MIHTYTENEIINPGKTMLKHLISGFLLKDAGWFVPSFISGAADLIGQKDLLKGGVYTPGVGDVVTTTATLYLISDIAKEQDSSIPKDAVASIEYNITAKTADGRIYMEPENYNKLYYGYDKSKKEYYRIIDGEYAWSVGSHLAFMRMFDAMFSQGLYYGSIPGSCGMENKGYNEAPYNEPTYFWGDYLW